MASESPIGDNLARLRHARGLTQEQLAAASNVSVGVITGLEQHRKAGARWATLQRLANALGVALPSLVTPPALLAEPGDTAGGSDLVELRRALTGTDDLLGDTLVEPEETTPTEQIATSVDAAWSSYQRGEFTTVLHQLPTLIGDARRAAHAENDPDHAWRLLSYCFSAAAGIAVMRGHSDLALTAVERAAAAGRRAASPLAVAAGAIFGSWILLKQGRYDDSEALAVSAAERAEPSFTHGSRAEMATFGNLMINASCAAVRAGATERAADHLSVARAAASRHGIDGIDHWAVFGPRVVGMYAACNAAEAGDLDTAITAAERVPDAIGGQLPRTWEARYRLNVAYACSELGRGDQAVALLAQARTLAPEWIRLHPLGHTVVRDQLTRSNRPSDQLAALAAHLNVA
ncbi:helix-turn-helix domain-containing protein [Actinocatenispora comari]|uniref:Transcriptional regulator n=1 Tax=Actinocatenispora comari TaxID=2807577 RepID=A0A8J4ESJ9_9ACTN|nr:helix-turn-helix domain-containing protein [Actinocatenispora comari]GIL32019.1 transcriptional regulator [Actinocatenispora comari]